MLSYIDPAVTPVEADAYADARGNTAWVGDLAAKTAALRRGQDYIASTYNHLWAVSFTDATAPAEVKYAITEAAIREITAPGSLSPDFDPSAVVKREKVKAGPVESETEFADSKDAKTGAFLAATFPAIDNLLRGLIRQPGASIFVV